MSMHSATDRKIIYALLAVIAAIILAWLLWPSPPAPLGITRIDTVFVSKPLPIQHIDSASITLPYRVLIYKKDSIARQQAEKQDIITYVAIERGVLIIDKLTPRGIGIREEHKLPELAKIEIDGTGKTSVIEDKRAKRKKWWRKAGHKAAVVGAAVAGVLVGSKL